MFNILPMWHPIRLAEDFAMVDILTEGRVVFGYRATATITREVESFGAPMDRRRRQPASCSRSSSRLLMKAFNSDAFSHRGKHYIAYRKDIPYRGYDLKEVTLVPRPLDATRVDDVAAHRQRISTPSEQTSWP